MRKIIILIALLLVSVSAFNLQAKKNKANAKTDVTEIAEAAKDVVKSVVGKSYSADIDGEYVTFSFMPDGSATMTIKDDQGEETMDYTWKFQDKNTISLLVFGEIELQQFTVGENGNTLSTEMAGIPFTFTLDK